MGLLVLPEPSEAGSCPLSFVLTDPWTETVLGTMIGGIVGVVPDRGLSAVVIPAVDFWVMSKKARL
jgi:hypothetical protein